LRQNRKLHCIFYFIYIYFFCFFFFCHKHKESKGESLSFTKATTTTSMKEVLQKHNFHQKLLWFLSFLLHWMCFVFFFFNLELLWINKILFEKLSHNNRKLLMWKSQRRKVCYTLIEFNFFIFSVC
jgi:hypothetical protein